jgi:ATP-dependent helicase/nuclease subunit B
MDEALSGLQIQLIYYMGAVLDIEKKRHSGSEVIPAGAFYFNIKSPYIDRLSDRYSDELTKEEREKLDEKYKKSFLEEYRMTGIVNSDRQAAGAMDKSLDNGERSLIIPIKAADINSVIGKSFMNGSNFNDIIEYVRNKTEKMCDEILSGDIETNPYIKMGRTPCDYCGFKEICTFTEKYTGGKHRKLKKYETEEILEQIKRTDMEE